MFIIMTEMFKADEEIIAELTTKYRELEKENDRLKEELKLVREDNDKFNEDVKQLVEEKKELNVKLTEANKKLLNSRYGLQSMTCDELLAENRRLLEKQANLESHIDILATTCDNYTEIIDELAQENEELKQTKKTLWKHWCEMKSSRNEYHHLYKQLMSENKNLLQQNGECEEYKSVIEDLQKLKMNLETEAEYRKSVSIHNAELQRENERLQEELEELKEKLQASSDLTMTDEIAWLVN